MVGVTPDEVRHLDQARALAQNARYYQTERDRAIRLASNQGLSFRSIAEAVGMTHAGVAKIVRKG